MGKDMLKKIFNKIKRKFYAEESDRQWIPLGTTAGRAFDRSKYGQNSFLATNIRAIVTAACNGEIRLKKADGEVIEYEAKGKEPLLDLLYKPAPFLNENIFKQIIISQLLIFGNIYLLKTGRDNRGRPTMLIPIPAPSVTIEYDGKGFPAAYKIQSKNGAYTVPLTDIIHIYEGNALSMFSGTSRTALCNLDADIMNSAKVFNLSFFTNGASVGGVLTFPEDVRLRDDEKRAALAMFNDIHSGAQKSHRTALIMRGGKYESFKTSHKDMEFAEGQKFSQQQIFSAMGVPPALVGLFEFAPQYNTKEQQKIFYETTIIPIMRLVSEGLTEDLVSEFYSDEGVYLEYDFSKVKALEEDWLNKAQALQILAQKFPLNECKRVLDLPFSDVVGGDEPPDPILTAFSGLNAPKVEQKGVKKIIKPTDAQQRAHKAAKLKLYEDLSPIMAEAMGKHFSNQHDLIKAWLDNGNEEKTFDYDAIFGSRKAQVDALLLLKVPAMSQIFNAGFVFEQEYTQSIAPSKDFKFKQIKDLQDRVRFWAEKYAFLWAESIERTTFKQLDAIIKTLTANGESNAIINRAVLAFFSENGYEPADNAAGQTVYNRVQTIVQTETLATISEAALEAYRSTPFVNGKEWITTKGVTDHHIGHLEMDGQIVGLNEDFVNPVTGDRTQAPGKFGIAGQDINCLCDFGPVILD